jgi:predicted SnoaL-like aldol condensation-catalyzing enzyme
MKNYIFLLSAISIIWLTVSCTSPTSGKSDVPCETDSLTAINKAIVLDFFTTAFVKKEVKAAFDNYVREEYIQHNPGIGNGRELPVQYLSDWLKDNPEASCEIRRVIAEHDLVVIHSHWKDAPDKPGQAGVDIFRVEQGKIAEHWDVLQDVPEKSENTNTMF